MAFIEEEGTQKGPCRWKSSKWWQDVQVIPTFMTAPLLI